METPSSCVDGIDPEAILFELARGKYKMAIAIGR